MESKLLPIANTLWSVKPASSSLRAMLCTQPFTEKSSGVAPKILTAFFRFSGRLVMNRSA